MQNTHFKCLPNDIANCRIADLENVKKRIIRDPCTGSGTQFNNLYLQNKDAGTKITF